MRQFSLASTCLATMLLQAVFQETLAVGRSFSEGGGLRSSVTVASPAEVEEQEENMEVMEEVSVPEVPKKITRFQPQALVQFPSYASPEEKPVGWSVDPPYVAKTSPQKSDVRAPSQPFLQAMRKEPSKSPIPSNDATDMHSATLPTLLPKPSQEEKDEKTEIETYSLEAPVKQPWPPPSGRKKCHPKCMEGRGVCNDNVCFCKSPYTGVSCQHKIKDLTRFPIPMVIAFGVFCFIVSSVLARLAFWCPCMPGKEAAAGHVKKEVWHPPDATASKKKDGPRREAPDPSHGVDDHT